MDKKKKYTGKNRVGRGDELYAQWLVNKFVSSNE